MDIYHIPGDTGKYWRMDRHTPRTQETIYSKGGVRH